MSPKQPILTLTSRLLIRLTEATEGWSRVRSTVVVLGIFASVVVTDYLLGATVSVAFLYFAACAIAVWCLGERTGMAISTVAAIANSLVKRALWTQLHMPHMPSHTAEAWNIVARTISFGVLAVVVTGFRGVLTLERWRGSHDGLTGALNKLAFDREMEAAIMVARAGQRDLVLAYMDLDGFKAINDEHGHSAGDRVLSTFATAAGASIRESDLFARLGGDEFAALMVLPRGANGMQVADALHRRLTAILAQTGFDVTCSMGAVVISAQETMFGDGIIEQADALMYEVKRAGKNALRVANASPVTAMLRASYQPPDDHALDHLIGEIDAAERRRSWNRQRRAA